MKKQKTNIADLCNKAEVPAETKKQIIQVYNSERKKLKYQNRVMDESGFVPVSLSHLEETVDLDTCEEFISEDPGPEEVVLFQEKLFVLKTLVMNLPGKYRTVVETALDNDLTGIFAKDRESKYGEIKQMAELLGVSTRTVARYAEKIRTLLREAGKDYFGKGKV